MKMKSIVWGAVCTIWVFVMTFFIISIVSTKAATPMCGPQIYVEADVSKEDLQPKLQQWENLLAQWTVTPQYNSEYTIIVKVPCGVIKGEIVGRK